MQSKYGRFPTFRDLNSGQPSEDHQVVAVDELRLGDVAQDRLDLARGLAQDACRLGRGVVDEAARDLAAVGPDDAHDLAALEAAFDRGRCDPAPPAIASSAASPATARRTSSALGTLRGSAE